MGISYNKYQSGNYINKVYGRANFLLVSKHSTNFPNIIRTLGLSATDKRITRNGYR